MSKGSVLVIGGGIVGLCSAYYLSQEGYEVTILEKGSFTEGTSVGNAGMIVPSHFIPLAQPGMIAKGIRWMFDAESPFYVKPGLSVELLKWGWQFYRHSTKKHVERSVEVIKKLNLESKQLYKELSETLDGITLHSKGLIMYCKTKKTFEEEITVAEYAHKLGMKAEVLDQDGLRILDPAMEIDVAGGVYFPEDAFLTPGVIIDQLITVLKKAGVTLLDNCSVGEIVFKGNNLESVATNKGEFTAEQYVIAAGAWSKKVASQLNINIPLQAGKGYSFTLPKPVQMPDICSILTEAKVAVTPMSKGLRFAGTMEIGGLDLSINHRRVKGIVKSIPTYFPGFKPEDFDAIEVSSGLRPCSPDGLPYIGRAKAYDNLVVATGHGMMGMSMGPITGKLVSQLINEENTSIDLSGVSVDRFN